MQIFRALQLSNKEHKLDILDKCPLLAPSFSLASASLKYNLFGEQCNRLKTLFTQTDFDIELMQ